MTGGILFGGEGVDEGAGSEAIPSCSPKLSGITDGDLSGGLRRMFSRDYAGVLLNCRGRYLLSAGEVLMRLKKSKLAAGYRLINT